MNFHSVRQECPAGGIRWEDGRCIPEGIADPPATWVLDYGVTALGIAFLILMVVLSIRSRTLTWSLMLSVASASTWWLETFGDWGQHLSYSPAFIQYSVDLPFTAHHNPLWMPVMYAVYWVAHAWAILRLAQWWAARKPGRTLGKGILVLSIPLTFVWNLLIEGLAAYMGWWTYEPGFGPVLDMGRGNWPLLWPMLLMFGWINLIAWIVGLPEEHGAINKLERWCGLGTLLAKPGWHHPGGTVRTAVDAGVVATEVEAAATPVVSAGDWRFQTVRMLAWIVVFNVTFFLTLVVPLVGLRLITGHDSPYLP